jgi:preprotein translocase subunit SecG
MQFYLNLVQIIISVVLVVVILLQAKGSGLGGIFGGDGGFYRTRRGLEKTLFNVTIVLAALFLLISLVSVLVGG